MKIRSTFHVLVLLMAVLTFSMPFVTFAASVADEQAKAVADGERDAEARVNKTLWFGVGCLTGVIGTVLAYNLPPTPSPEQLIGKSPEYVDFYTTAYQAKAKSIQGRSALIGCGVTTGTVATIYGLFFASCLAGAAASVDTTSP